VTLRLSRRAAAVGLAALAAAPALGRVGPARAALDPANPRDVAAMFRKLRYRMSDGLVFWWMVDTKIGQVGATLTELWGMQVGSIMRLTNRADGGFDTTSLEVVFYTDLKTGEFLREWTNPYTGERHKIPHAPVGPTTIAYSAEGRSTPPKELGGSRLENTTLIGPAVAVNDDVWVRHDSIAKVISPDPARKPFEVNDLSIYQGRLSELADPAVDFAEATVQSQQVTSWRAWMNMGDRPGGMTSRGVGRKVRSYAEMPRRWRDLVAEIDPEIAADPVGALERPAAKFDR
jgi:hypothetical protein